MAIRVLESTTRFTSLCAEIRAPEPNMPCLHARGYHSVSGSAYSILDSPVLEAVIEVLLQSGPAPYRNELR